MTRVASVAVTGPHVKPSERRTRTVLAMATIHLLQYHEVPQISLSERPRIPKIFWVGFGIIPVYYLCIIILVNVATEKSTLI